MTRDLFPLSKLQLVGLPDRRYDRSGGSKVESQKKRERCNSCRYVECIIDQANWSRSLSLVVTGSLFQSGDRGSIPRRTLIFAFPATIEPCDRYNVEFQFMGKQVPTCPQGKNIILFCFIFFFFFLFIYLFIYLFIFIFHFAKRRLMR